MGAKQLMTQVGCNIIEFLSFQSNYPFNCSTTVFQQLLVLIASSCIMRPFSHFQTFSLRQIRIRHQVFLTPSSSGDGTTVLAGRSQRPWEVGPPVVNLTVNGVPFQNLGGLPVCGDCWPGLVEWRATYRP